MLKVDDERQRLEALRRYQILDTPPEPEFDRITALTARLFRAHTAVITLIDERRQWFKSRFGLAFQQTARDVAFCSHTIESDRELVVLDAARDPCFADNPLVTGPPHIRFYAGSPLRTRDGFALGTLAIIDSEPRASFDEAQRTLLATMAAVVVDELELRVEARALHAVPLPSLPGEGDARVRLLLDQLPAMVWTTDAELRITSLAGAGMARLGVRPADLIGRFAAAFIGSPQDPGAASHHLRALAGQSVVLDYDVRGHSFDFRLDPLRDAGGAIIGVVGMGLDITERVSAQRALQRSEKRLRELLGCTDGIIFELDGNARFVNVWTAREDLLVRPARELVGRTLTEVLAPAQADPLLARITRVLATGVKETFEHGQSLRGSEHWFLVDAVPLPESGTVALLARDISGRRAVEEQLREAQRRLKHLLSAGPAVTYSASLSGRFAVTFVSENVRELTGYRANEFIHSSSFWIDHVHPDDVDSMAPAIFSALANGTHAHDYRFRCSNGAYRWIHDELRVLRRPDGTPVESIGFWTDVTELKRSEAALLDSQQRYQLIARATNDVIWDWDLTTNALWWNDSVYTTFRYARGEIGSTADWWYEHLLPEDRPRVVAGIHAAIARAGESNWSDEYRFLRGDGSAADVLDRGFILRAPDGKATRMVGAMLDVTERNRMQAQVMQSDRLASVGTLASGVAHEINNPLSYVVANVSFARESIDRVLDGQVAAAEAMAELKEARLALADAEVGGSRVRQIVRDLKIFGRADDLRMTSVDVRAVVESALAMVLNEIRHCATLERQLGPAPPVHANESQLAQVFLNLAINAVQAIGEGHAAANVIRVAVGTDARGWARVDVQDSGPGIPAHLIGRLFDPFFTTKPLGVGTGLGLSICHGIVTALGGEITVQSKSGEGATFTVCLPPATPSPVAAVVPAARGRSASGTRRRVLIIDDDPAVVRALERAFDGEHELSSCTSGREALHTIEANPHFDIILCDLMMPDLAGMDVHQVLAQRHPALAERMVFMSGGAFTPRARAFLDAVANPRVEKPFDVEALRKLLRDLS